jgi:hypothetical protein
MDVSNFQELLRLRRADVDPRLIRALGPTGAERATQLGAEVVSRGGQAARAATSNPRMAGTLGATALLAGGNLLSQDPLGAAASVGGGLAGGGIGSLAVGLLPKPLQAAGRFALPAIGSLVGGMGAEQAVKGFAGKAEEAGRQPGAGPDVEVGGVPLTETAAARKQIEFAGEMSRQQQLKDLQQLAPAQIAAAREAYQMMNQINLEQEKAMIPLRERMMRTQLVNQQAINASNAALYQQMGRSATMGKLALGAQAEAGATTRTLLSQNPYAGAVLQAPQISFG